jgi:predicted RNA-binding Zn-ribbon protein involved in translation (DUF1610 family)
MTRIRATCPTCGEIDLRPADIHLEVVRDADEEVAEGSVYRFECPGCADQVTKPADDRIARLLTTGGVPVSVAEPQPVGAVRRSHPEDPPAGPAFTLDDVITFHHQLRGDDWFSELRAMVR